MCSRRRHCRQNRHSQRGLQFRLAKRCARRRLEPAACPKPSGKRIAKVPQPSASIALRHPKLSMNRLPARERCLDRPPGRQLPHQSPRRRLWETNSPHRRKSVRTAWRLPRRRQERKPRTHPGRSSLRCDDQAKAHREAATSRCADAQPIRDIPHDDAAKRKSDQSERIDAGDVCARPSFGFLHRHKKAVSPLTSIPMMTASIAAAAPTATSHRCPFRARRRARVDAGTCGSPSSANHCDQHGWRMRPKRA